MIFQSSGSGLVVWLATLRGAGIKMVFGSGPFELQNTADAVRLHASRCPE